MAARRGPTPTRTHPGRFIHGFIPAACYGTRYGTPAMAACYGTRETASALPSRVAPSRLAEGRAPRLAIRDMMSR